MGGSSEFGIDLEAARAFLAAKDEARRGALDKRFASASADFERILNAIKADGRAERVWQWGSLLDRSRFSEISDIDVAVEGLPGPDAYFDLLGKLAELTRFPIDLLELEKLDEADARSIRERGRLVYERGA